MVMRQAVDRHILNGDQAELVDDAAAALVSKVAPSSGNTFMRPRHDLAPLSERKGHLFFFAEAALHLGERVFLGAEEPRVGDLLPRTRHGEHLQSYIYTHLLVLLRRMVAALGIPSRG
jgi:hypothetical protein